MDLGSIKKYGSKIMGPLSSINKFINICTAYNQTILFNLQKHGVEKLKL